MSSENKGTDQLCSYCTADLRLWFHICRLLVFWCDGSVELSVGHYLEQFMKRFRCLILVLQRSTKTAPLISFVFFENYKLRREKTDLQDFHPCLTQIGLYSRRRMLYA